MKDFVLRCLIHVCGVMTFGAGVLLLSINHGALTEHLSSFAEYESGASYLQRIYAGFFLLSIGVMLNLVARKKSQPKIPQQP